MLLPCSSLVRSFLGCFVGVGIGIRDLKRERSLQPSTTSVVLDQRVPTSPEEMIQVFEPVMPSGNFEVANLFVWECDIREAHRGPHITTFRLNVYLSFSVTAFGFLGDVMQIAWRD